MAAHLLTKTGKASGAADLGAELEAQAIKPHLIHEAVTAEMAWRRAGTHSTKTRTDVSGGGKKPWRQKGTGRARAGSNRSPIWVGGGVVFGPHPRSYGGKVNRKAHRQAFRSALKAHVERGSIAVMEPTGWDSPSTKRAAEYLATAPEQLAARPLLVVVTESSSPEALSFRNMRDVRVLEARDIETVDIMAGRSILVEREVWDRWNGAPAPAAAAEGDDA
jgi:large subunit ribosomal protein L4